MPNQPVAKLLSCKGLIRYVPHMQADRLGAPSAGPSKKRRRHVSNKQDQQQQPIARVRLSNPAAPASIASTSIDNTPSMTPRASTPEQLLESEASRGFTTTRFKDFLTAGQISQPTFDGIASLRPVHECEALVSYSDSSCQQTCPFELPLIQISKRKRKKSELNALKSLHQSTARYTPCHLVR